MNDYPEKCECCGRPLDDKCLFHIGTHTYVCSFACHKYMTEKLMETFCPVEKLVKKDE